MEAGEPTPAGAAVSFNVERNGNGNGDEGGHRHQAPEGGGENSSGEQAPEGGGENSSKELLESASPAPSSVGAWILEHSGLQWNLDHFNREDPFLIKRRKSSWWTEVRAGTVTFLTMAFILPVNASIMSLAMGQEYRSDLVVATAAVSSISSVLMGLLANYPFGLAPGMGLNAYFVFTVVFQKGIPWETALTAVFFSGWLFLLTTVLGLRNLLLRLIPPGIQLTLGAGIGLFLALVGSVGGGGMGIIAADPDTLVKLNEPLTFEGNYDAAKMWVSVLVLLVTTVMMGMNVRGAPLFGIVFGTVIAWSECWAKGQGGSAFLYPFDACADVGVNGLNGTECFCYAPKEVVAAPAIGTAGRFSFDVLNNKDFWVAVLTFFFNDLIGCAGTLIAVTRKAGIVDKDGKMPKENTNCAFLVDSVGTIIGSCLGTSTVTSYVESASGVVDGGRTGFAAIVIGLWFLLSIPFAPLVSQIPDLATGPILVIIGTMMCTSIQDFDWGDFEESVPAFITLVMIPFTFNIAYGIIGGTFFWLLVQIFLVPFRLFKRQDPLIKIKLLFASQVSHSKMCAHSALNKRD